MQHNFNKPNQLIQTTIPILTKHVTDALSCAVITKKWRI